jgi:hypothetical protein
VAWLEIVQYLAALARTLGAKGADGRASPNPGRGLPADPASLVAPADSHRLT